MLPVLASLITGSLIVTVASLTPSLLNRDRCTREVVIAFCVAVCGLAAVAVAAIVVSA